jgi:hypothetical protein
MATQADENYESKKESEALRKKSSRKDIYCGLPR